MKFAGGITGMRKFEGDFYLRNAACSYITHLAQFDNVSVLSIIFAILEHISLSFVTNFFVNKFYLERKLWAIKLVVHF